MKTHTFADELWLPLSPENIFPFFADAHNLQLITPPWLKFEVLTPAPIRMAAGTRIDYRLKIRGLPIRWQSEITVWEPPFCFVDEQRRGPYRRWIHRHTFQEKDGGTLCRDEVRYAVPGGTLVNWLIVRHDIRRIFQFRRETLRQRFALSG